MWRTFRKSSVSRNPTYKGNARFEHWYLDNCVYFITSRCRNRAAAIASEESKAVFWDRFRHYTREYGFIPWVTTLLDNHYHTIGYLKDGENLGPMMQRVHGSVAKLVNDLRDVRLKPFWWDTGKQGYFDGCVRDEKQARRAYRYIVRQSERHGLARDWRTYAHTRVNVEIERAVKRAVALEAFLKGVPYARYVRKHGGNGAPD